MSCGEDCGYSFPAGGTLVEGTHEHRFIELSSNGQIIPLATIANVLGVLCCVEPENDPVAIVASGRIKVEASATITAGTQLHAVVGGTVEHAGGHRVGVALEGGESGDLVEMLLHLD